MNIQAVVKTLLVVVGIGALTGFNQWKHTAGAPAAVRAQQTYNQCMSDRKEAAYRENPISSGRDDIVQTRRFEADCTSQANGEGIQLGKGAPKPTGIVESNGLHYAPNGQIQTESREECLGRLEDARKRTKNNLNAEWEKGEANRCQSLYSTASN